MKALLMKERVGNELEGRGGVLTTRIIEFLVPVIESDRAVKNLTGMPGNKSQQKVEAFRPHCGFTTILILITDLPVS
jgi:hypothetical protein